MKSKLKSFLIISLFTSCYGINEKSSEIGSLNYDFGTYEWNQIFSDFSTSYFSSNVTKQVVEDFKKKPFKVDLIYLKEPREIIGISEDHYSIRYIFNPIISDQILDGLSSQLTESEKQRIKNRIARIVEVHGCKTNK
ncbi:hypothetical protein [Mangrovimonas sp. YM274]|uniref:hypothetical protein n=1 Tax=Mangrovimonas sp. YM274 TaxID=3070660 RepID=UPI0027DAC058|nr:hypothetical protein [Mangrovimonas sp. YM274]WMI68194.1 hypothetical protein RBH95_13695 [Mangrovimonas sp. YM274]